MTTQRAEVSGGSTPGLIDTHCHLVDLQRLRYPWLQQVPALQHNFSVEQYRAQALEAGITGAIYI